MSIKKLSFLLIAFGLITSCAPKDKMNWSYKRVKKYEKSIKCTLTTKYTVEQRRKMFPFDKSSKVLFISYKNKELGSGHLEMTEQMDTSATPDGKQIILPKIDEINSREKSLIIKKWGYLDRDTTQIFNRLPGYAAIESIELNSNQIDTLSNLLLNYQLSKSPLTSYSVGCYSPRNAILFINDKNQIVAFIEICFECIQMYFSYNEADEKLCNCHCGERREAVNVLFKSIGIKYGLDVKH